MAIKPDPDGSSSSILSDLREMEAKLKCLVCKNLLQQPTWMTCGHVLCKHCIPKDMVSLCPICKARFLARNLKPARQIEEMLKKYQEIEASTKVPNRDNVSQVGTFAEDFGPILTPQSNQRGSTSMMNNPCQEDSTRNSKASSHCGDRVLIPPFPPGFEKRACELGIIGSPRAISAKLMREEPPKDSSAEVATSAKASATPGGSQVHGITMDNEFQLQQPNFNMRTKEACLKNSCSVPCMNPCTSRKKRTDREEWARPSAKRLKITSSRVPVNLFEDECIFCHSFRRDLKGFGELLCIQNGKLVAEVDSASKARVLYAHESCLDWSPRIYYKDDQIMNLKIEIGRTAKLICAKCGLKGAALGCFNEKCRKSYHPPCAYRILECRWDTENYCMLCPDHASEELPCDSGPTTSDTEANGNGSRTAERQQFNHLWKNANHQQNNHCSNRSD
ncbi:hypothetical protein LUZ63_015794 [Rhynchospora breviuscula]|uniref:RING-type domain-containing protein n=1 Tax=Rhynchospora breviuscula TaxID=2022672 RepID=A0A9Q0CDQ4_9POAL|nr:hypothetical protein LUZ63_015794 [Rhynchospora breviuscula]